MIFMIRDICINSNLNPLTKFTSNSRSTGLKDILVETYHGTSHFEVVGKSVETETKTWSEFPNGGKAIVEPILASEEKNNSKEQGYEIHKSEIRVGKLTTSVRSFEIGKL